jgi:hypothetical protein
MRGSEKPQIPQGFFQPQKTLSFTTSKISTVVAIILEMKKGSRAAGIGKGSGPKARQKISDITDFQKKRILEITIFES